MAEVGLALIVFATLAAGVVVQACLSWQQLLVVGATTVAVGVVASIVGGAAYHLALHRALAPRRALDPRWHWHPTALHGRLRPNERRAVLLPFGVGAAGFGLVLVGCALVLLAAFGGGPR